MSKNKVLIIIIMPIVTALCVVTGILLGGFLTPVDVNSRSFIFPPNTRMSNGNKLNEILNFIEGTYVDSVDKNDLTERSISSMLSQLDPHSYYIPARDFDNLNDPLEGNFEGIGVEFRIIHDTVLIVSPIVNGPSEKLGIKAGDKIMKVDSVSIAGIGITNDKVVKLLKGPRGTKVEVDIKRPEHDKLIHYTIIRDRIPLSSVDSPYMIEEKTGYLRITRFSKTTYQEFMIAVEKLIDEGMKNLIIDLRGNGGGILGSAIKIVDEILAKNKMIVYTDGRVRNKDEYFSTDGGTLESCEVTVLINESSASASEILAGAIQDNDRGLVIGRRSFGKGLVQEQVSWPDGSALRLTVARYFTPTGRCIQKPYGTDLEKYHAEAYDRYSNGELLSADSIQFPDSLKFYTPEGKLVYGGGGIMPDIFVPLDTTNGTPYLFELRLKGIIQQFVLEYLDKKRKELKEEYKDAIDFRNRFKVNNDLFNSVIKFADDNNVKRNLKEITISRELISRGIKASLNQNLFNELGYYVIINEHDVTVQKALNFFKKK